MRYGLYSYYDRVSGLYSAPVPAVNRATAIRQFLEVQRQNPSANDVEIYEVGTFDITTGELIGKKAEFVCTYQEYSDAYKKEE